MKRYRWLAGALLAALLVAAGALPAAAQTPMPPTLPPATGQPSPQFVSMMLGCAEVPGWFTNRPDSSHKVGKS